MYVLILHKIDTHTICDNLLPVYCYNNHGSLKFSYGIYLFRNISVLVNLQLQQNGHSLSLEQENQFKRNL